MDLRLSVNGAQLDVTVEARQSLADVLRHGCGLTGTHVGCEHGVCGACTVVVDGTAIRSCLMLAVQAEGRDVRTVESLADEEGELSSLQTSFAESGALQCGFCTPGILMTLSAWLDEAPAHRRTVDEVLDGHLCRCTGYGGIRRAVARLVHDAEVDA